MLRECGGFCSLLDLIENSVRERDFHVLIYLVDFKGYSHTSTETISYAKKIFLHITYCRDIFFLAERFFFLATRNIFLLLHLQEKKFLCQERKIIAARKKCTVKRKNFLASGNISGSVGLYFYALGS